ncbi:CocE/NonD family hydrolase [Sphingomonas sp. So64.6b]|uniref:CocE/NonD family hydrolase n=1 Tax=Sphingomonas sp. So64.6b TaxID=2997354 RepID=UPI001603839A|nr:CocE/NonD family hydrolase [Sphingomonas sp. So64.6b]QNA85479.1 CocE/NonD family hydrolase [Sphingomonas sp. So64.6b]
MRPGVDPASAPNKPPLPPLEHVVWRERGLVIERNAGICLRDGTEIYADLYRPEGEADLPTLLAWGPYGKHALSNQVFWPLSGVDPDWLSPLTPFEGPDPLFWGRLGYAVAVVDPRGAWLSGGDFHHNGRQEAEDCYDTICWLADRPGSNGKIGMTGVSYLAAIQYLVASLRPPALVALNPWEGFSDWYREFAYHGGIPETGFLPRASDNIRFSLNRTEDSWANIQAHPMIDPFWRSKEIDLEAIDQPAYVVASWSDQGLHLRGTIEAYRRMGSAQKWLEVHGQKKWAHYYRPESRARQHAFFDHYLKGRTTQAQAWPRVRIEVREAAGVAVERAEAEWPLARTIYTRLWLDAATGLMTIDEPAREAEFRYDAVTGHAAFDLEFDQDTEITGHTKLRLWAAVEGADDMDLFVAAQKLDRAKMPVGFTFYAFYDNGPAALGWLRASHRALDSERSSPSQPVHLHEVEEPLTCQSARQRGPGSACKRRPLTCRRSGGCRRRA